MVIRPEGVRYKTPQGLDIDNKSMNNEKKQRMSNGLMWIVNQLSQWWCTWHKTKANASSHMWGKGDETAQTARGAL
jgi:hypothetical protein